ncbi:TylF/MycF/NovP-related O-methyltransferase [Bradyrhizobium sp. WSM1417]|uniref:TylF/MycF/NovP-related O-methyltransferase n=1 Tax=Bradyrhizobium sp. WSM1417 TaxID=754500 RepID=UPI000484E230|nr:TylF/MycF/NovP-related O-methyltransferase [Bradyrhizobium sp. WSM1417]
MTHNEPAVAGGFRTEAEQHEAAGNKLLFEANALPWEKKIENFPKYVRRQNLTRFLALYEIFKQVVEVKGSIIECGVHQGFGIMTWAKLSAIMEPVNLTRRIYGFDTFGGFPDLDSKDIADASKHVKAGDLAADSYDEIMQLSAIHDSTRFIGHIPKVKLIKGDGAKTIPQFVNEHPHLVVSLLFLDFDLYEGTKVALESFVPRMPKGAIIAFDELDNPLWPGETLAMVEFCQRQKLQLRRLSFDPYIAYAVID